MITKDQADELVQKHETFFRKELEIKGRKIFIYNYMLSDKEAFSDMNNLGRELRGLTFVQNGLLKRFLSIPKFFNINEIPENEETKLKNKKIKKVSDKLDGSLIQPILIDGEVLMKTKISFENPQAKLAQEMVDSNSELKFFILDCFDNDFQPLFELIGPDNKHVLDYLENKLVLIAVRNQEGEFIDIDKFDYPYRAKSYNLTLDEIIHSCKNDKDKEGYVIKFTDGTLVKAKTLDYLEKHRVFSELDSYKIILKRTLQEDMDDLYQIAPKDKIEELRKIEQSIIDYTLSFIEEIETIVEMNKSQDKGLVAQRYKDHPFFGVIMQGLKGKNIKENVIKVLLHKYRKEQQAKMFINNIMK